MENIARHILTPALKAAWPILAGYVVLGIPCGFLAQAAGLEWWMALLMSFVLYSGVGQYMIPNMWLAGNPLASIILSVSLVNTRQMLYGASLSRFCAQAGKRLSYIFGATVTDESFGVNLALLEQGDWGIKRATAVNFFSMTTWALANAAGVLIAGAVSLPTALASYAMTALFICLLCMQAPTVSNLVAAMGATVGVVVCKLVGLSGMAIFIGAVIGVAAAMLVPTSACSEGEASRGDQA